MQKLAKTSATVDEIAAMATRGEDVSSFVTNQFTVVRPVHGVKIVLTHGVLRDLEAKAKTKVNPKD